MNKHKIEIVEISVETFKVKAKATKEMIYDLSKMGNIEDVIKRAERKEIYDRRKRIIETLLK